MMTVMADTPAKPRRRWFSFSLRTLFVLTSLAGLAAGQWQRRVRLQRQTILELGQYLGYSNHHGDALNGTPRARAMASYPPRHVRTPFSFSE